MTGTSQDLDTKQHKTTQPDAIDWKIAEISMTNPSITDEEIGLKVGLSRGAVNRRRQRPAYQTIFQRASEQAQANLMLLMEKAVSELGRCLEDHDPRIRLTAASQILKNAPKPPEQMSNERRLINVNLTWIDDEPGQENVTYTTEWGSQSKALEIPELSVEVK